MAERTKQIVLETERLVLRRINLDDASFMFKLLNTDDWIKYIGDRNIRSLEASENYLKEKFLIGNSFNGLGMLLVQFKNKAEAIGICGLVNRDGLDAADIGFAFLPEFYGMGYAYESATSVLKFAREELALPKVLAITVKENIKSIQLLEKLGMKFKETIRIPRDEEELMLYEVVF